MSLPTTPIPPPRGLRKRFEYVRDHFRYNTMNSWNQATAPARCIKIYELGFERELVDKAFQVLEVDNYHRLSGFTAPLDDWQAWWGHEYQWGTNGRSGGYVVMYHGRLEPSGYQSVCEHCGQLNYAEVVDIQDDTPENQLYLYVVQHNHWRPEVYPRQSQVQRIGLPAERVVELIARWRDEWRRKYGDQRPKLTAGNRCGRCRRDARVNLENHLKVVAWPGRSVFDDYRDCGFEEAHENLDIEHAFEVVYSFDVAVDWGIENFRHFCRTHEVEDEEYQVTRTRRVARVASRDEDSKE